RVCQPSVILRGTCLHSSASSSNCRGFASLSVGGSIMLRQATLLPVLFAALILTPTVAHGATFQVIPAAVVLHGDFARCQLLVTALELDGTVNERSADLTLQAAFQSSQSKVVMTTATGRLLAVANGDAVVTVTVAGVTRSVPVKVMGIQERPV